MRALLAPPLAFGLCLTGCSTGSTARLDAIDRVLAEGVRKAQPTEVVAIDLAMSRAARKDGQWAALRDYAAAGAVLHLPEGPIAADRYLRGRPFAGAAQQWGADIVWMSCDSRVAVSHGKYVEPGGSWGYYVTAWARQPDGGYRWTYMLRAPDAALTQRQRSVAQTVDEDGTIVVQGISMIRGETGDCLAGAARPVSSGEVPPVDAQNGSAASPDGTLVWRWAGLTDGRRRFVVLQADQGRLEQAFAMEVASGDRVSITR